MTSVTSLMSLCVRKNCLAYGVQCDISNKFNEPVREKSNNLGSDQVRHKPGCTVTEDG